MSDPNPKNIDSPANPLQPGDPFKRGNFNRFALGMCLIIAAFLLAAIVFFFLKRGQEPTPAPARPSSAIRVGRPIQA